MDPPVDAAINAEAMHNIIAAWPAFAQATIEEVWAGSMDITPDSLPVIGPVAKLPGLTLATGFSGHGFGTAPAAGQLAADLLMGAPRSSTRRPIVWTGFEQQAVSGRLWNAALRRIPQKPRPQKAPDQNFTPVITYHCRPRSKACM
jgi:glycine/D-amino acid oxidase-like deaminating enzyme